MQAQKSKKTSVDRGLDVENERLAPTQDNNSHRSTTMPAIKPCLWFQQDAEAAAEFYVSLFPDSRIAHVMRAGSSPNAPVIAVEFVLDGQPFTAVNGRHEAAFTDAHSFMVPCETQDDVDRYWNALTAGGEEGRCGWLTDRYGVSLQVIPNGLSGLLGNPDPAKAGRAMEAMLAMKKLDIAVLEAAARGD
jgi:predicted 3-demethylubiquinone-9 3-methyltransferase (glyoxalase superfamily)